MFSRSSLIAASVFALVGSGSFCRPSLAANTILIPMGPLEVKLPVADLESFVKTGTPGPELAPMVSQLPPERVRMMKTALGTRLPFPPKTLEKMLRSPMGPMLLNQLADVVKPAQSSISGTQAWETALTRATRSGRLAMIDIIREYPSDQVVFDVVAAQEKMDTLQTFRGMIGGSSEPESSTDAISPTPGEDKDAARAASPSASDSNSSRDTGSRLNKVGGLASLLLNNLGTIQNLAQSFGLYESGSSTVPPRSIPGQISGSGVNRSEILRIIEGFIDGR